MFALRSFDSFNTALQQSSYTMALRSRADLARVTHDLIQLYEGNQLPYLEAWLAVHTSDSALREKYVKLAAYLNITKMLVDRVSVVGLVRVIWVDQETGRPNRVAQDIWQRRLLEDHCSSDWDAFTQALDKRRNLCVTAVACPGWDIRNGEMTLDILTPDELDVEYWGAGAGDEPSDTNPESCNRLRPDRFVFIREEATGWSECWDFSSRASGASGTRTVRIPEGSSDEGTFPVIDPNTGRSVVPFVAFRTVEDKHSYFPWNNQDHLVQAQEFFNRCWTRISVLSEMGANAIPLLMGDGWADEEGRIKPIFMDITRPLKQPSGGIGDTNDKPKLAFIKPAVEELISGQLDLADEHVQMAAACLGVSASTIRAKNEAKSGYALQIEGSSLVRKHHDDVALVAAPYKRLAQIMRLYWDYHMPNVKFPENVVPTIVIPQSHSIVTTREAVDADVKLATEGLKRPLPIIFNAEPAIAADEAFAMADRFVSRNVPPGTDTGKATPPAAPPENNGSAAPTTQPPAAAGG